MPRDGIIKIFDYLLEAILLLIVGLSPIFFMTQIYAVWQLSEYFLFQVLVELAFLIWLFKMLFLWQTNSFSYFKDFILKRVKFVWPFLLFILILALVTIFSQAPRLSFFGHYFRRLGYLTWLHLFVFFLLLIFNLKNFSQLKRILAVILITAAITCLYGFLQIFGFDPFFWQEPATFTSRIFSTLGQPNFYGAWLVLIIPLVFYSLSLYQKNFVLKSLIWLLIFALFSNLFLTLSRGAWLGFLASLVFFLIAFAFLEKKRRQAFALLATVFCLGLLLLYFNFFYKARIFGPNIFLDRLLSFTRLKLEGGSRLLTWKASLSLIAKSPFLGYGPDNLLNQFVSYYRPENAIYEAINSYPDRAHNEILDITLISGLIGLASYLFLLGYSFYLGFKSLKSIPRSPALYLLSALFGYFVVNQLSFHVVPTLVYFVLYLALIYFLNSSIDENLKIQKFGFVSDFGLRIWDLTKKFFTNLITPKIKEVFIFSLLFLVVFLVGFSSFLFNWRPLLADYFFRKALVERINNSWPGMLKNYQITLFFSPNEPYYRQRFAMDLMWAATDFYQKKENKIEVLEMAAKNIEAIPISERSFEAKAYQAKMFALKASLTKNQEDFEKAEEAYKRVSSLSPFMAGVYNDWCQLEIDKKDWPTAFEKCQKALSLYPPLNHPDLNEHHRQMLLSEKFQVWQKMASLYLQEKNYSEAEKYYRKILKYQPFRPDIYKHLAEVYYLQKNFDEAIHFNLHAYNLNPKDPALSFGLAILYKEKGNPSQAKIWAEKALALNPAEAKEIKEFIKGLK